MSKTCTYPNCERGTYSEFCLMHKPRTPIKTVGIGRPLRRINHEGKQTKKWKQLRNAWFKDHPALAYDCHYCGKTFMYSQITLDHKIPRSRAPELRFDYDNLVPACWTCNGLKGSVAHDDYLHDCQV